MGGSGGGPRLGRIGAKALGGRERFVAREGHVARRVAGIGGRRLAEERRAQRGERDLELVVVGLYGGDLLHEEARPQERPEWPGRAVASEDALQLEGHRDDEGQERKLLEEEGHVVQN